MAGSGSENLRVLALVTHPVQSPGPRYRVIQLVEPLVRHGIQVDVQSFTDPNDYGMLFKPGNRLRKARWLIEGTFRRAARLVTAAQYDVLWAQVWLHPFSFPPYTLLLDRIRVPIVHDIDDAYYLPTGRNIDLLRRPSWIAGIMKRAHSVVAGSEFIAEFARQHNERVHIVPTAVDTDRFAPRDLTTHSNPVPVIGWVGTHSTFRFVERLFGVFESLAKTHRFVLRIVGAGQPVEIPGVTVENIDWTLEHEVDYFRDLDIGLYPLFDSVPAKAKHGFKLQQYMAVGVPAIVSDIGANSMLIRHGENAFLAASMDDWKSALAALLDDPDLRRRVGETARAQMDQDVSLRSTVVRYADFLHAAAASQR